MSISSGSFDGWIQETEARAPKQDSRAGTEEPTPTEAWIQVAQVKGKRKTLNNKHILR